MQKWINDTVKQPFYVTENLSAVYPEATTYKGFASGMMVGVIRRELGDRLTWFRLEQLP